MKRHLLITIIALFAIAINAEPISQQTAKQVAENFLASKNLAKMKNNKVELSLVLAETNQQFFQTKGINANYYYILGNENSFVIVAGDDIFTPILGYSDEGSFNPENIAPNTQKWLEGYKQEMNYAFANNISTSEERTKEWKDLTDNKISLPKSVRAVAKLCSTTWNQAPYYNAQCPYDNQAGERTVTGCVATAMAQVMKFWNYPTKGSGSHSYNHSKYGTLTANFGATTYNWTSMPNNVTGSNSAVATLMYHCGVAVNMDYGISSQGGSAANYQDTRNALVNYFAYKSSAQLLLRNNYAETTWKNTLKNELNAGRPILYAGIGTGGGHAFVCDGYDNNDYFHFNWGWGGSYDGFFAVGALNPGGVGIGGGNGGFNSNQHAIIGIEPAETQGGGTTNNYDLELYSNLTMTDTLVWFGDAFDLSVQIANYGNIAYSGKLYAVIISDDGTFIDVFDSLTTNLSSMHAQTYNFDCAGTIKYVPGHYNLAVFYGTSTGNAEIVNYTNYNPMKGMKIYYEDDLETYSAFTINGSSTLELTQNATETVNVDIANTGTTTFYGTVRVNLATLDNEYVQTIGTYNISSGLGVSEHFVNGLNFTGQITASPGTYQLQLAYQEDGAWYFAGSYFYPSAVYVIVKTAGIQPDAYEANNTLQTAYNLTLSFSGNSASKNTTGSNFHVGNDVDFYKIVLPAGYDYAISPRLHDSYNSGNGQTYTVDGLYSYSTDGGATWSATYDDIMSGNIQVFNGGTVYFNVAPYFSGNTGTYLLDLSILRSVNSAVEEIMSESAKIIIYPNPVSNELFINIDAIKSPSGDLGAVEIYDLSGKLQFSTTLHNIAQFSTKAIDVSQLNPGIYFLKINNNILKFVKK